MSESENPDYFIPTPLEVFDVQSILSEQGLPIELVDSIIEFAEYWPSQTVEVETSITVGNDSTFLYLQSQPLPGLFKTEIPDDGGRTEEFLVGEAEFRPVRKIVFTIWSHDQGWSSNRGRGSYEGSYTWFEAFAERPQSIAAIQNARPLPEPADISNDAKLQELQTSEGGGLAWKTIEIPIHKKNNDGLEGEAEVVTKKRWYVQANIHARSALKTHEITWAWNDTDEDYGTHNIETTGSGKGGDFVRYLKPGDRIRVAARAKYPGWVNHIEKMQLQIFCSV